MVYRDCGDAQAYTCPYIVSEVCRTVNYVLLLYVSKETRVCKRLYYKVSSYFSQAMFFDVF